MKKQTITRRLIFPAAVTLGLMIISINAYDLSGAIQNVLLQEIVVYTSAILMFATIWLGPLFVNTLAFFRGASFSERMLASLITPVVWIAKTYAHFIGIYSFGELVFLILHPLILGNIGVNLLCVGISELICRHRLRAKGGAIRLFEAPGIAALIAGLIITFAGLWNGGHTYYYYYMDVYSWLFM
ncbi:MAG: hypothetical protein C4548_11345 [Desulfobacteraceae bacterium]|jgi:hypothetical protein|nr:MAG: hypothetical protein C4548_11345 [Desulfobacteraceae bacterium]